MQIVKNWAIVKQPKVLQICLYENLVIRVDIGIVFRLVFTTSRLPVN